MAVGQPFRRARLLHVAHRLDGKQQAQRPGKRHELARDGTCSEQEFRLDGYLHESPSCNDLQFEDMNLN